MFIGYARVSTSGQNLSLQLDALTAAGCETVYREIASGAKKERTELSNVLAILRKGDVLVIWKLDRLGRSLSHLINIIDELAEREVGLRSLHDPIDTTTAHGRLIVNVFASLAEFERDLIRERTQSGLNAARARGRCGGRPKGLSKDAERKAIAAEKLYTDGDLTVTEISEQLGIARSTLYKYLRVRDVSITDYQHTTRKAQAK